MAAAAMVSTVSSHTTRIAKLQRQRQPWSLQMPPVVSLAIRRTLQTLIAAMLRM
jgi:hypothetical protein